MTKEERLDESFRRIKAQELIDRILYLGDKEFDEFMMRYDALCDAYKFTSKMKWGTGDRKSITINN